MQESVNPAVIEDQPFINQMSNEEVPSTDNVSI